MNIAAKTWQNLVIIASICMVPVPAVAGKSSFYEAQQCTQAIQQYENQYQIPKNLLHAISIVESGRWNDQAKKIMPWPWSVNVDGAAHYFDSRQQAVAFVKQKLKEGAGNIDVGCNQISWQYHGHNFDSLEQAMHPVHNSRFAAQFLRQHYMDTKDWVKAAGRYHSRTESLASIYSQKVHKTWRSKYAHYPQPGRSNSVPAAKPNPYHSYYNPYYARHYGSSGAKIKISDSARHTASAVASPASKYSSDRAAQIAAVSGRVMSNNSSAITNSWSTTE